ncbi:hypothetical protein SAMN05444352_10775 [Pseudomonas japonica]|uniref:Uncharacterized protein n=1 Tax=Pseudomonas japonica TaxID=256466 RepID=A0A239E2W6_9PSED|nr:hypothetical protein SAMN05444352_10775 [Pseudomonas japonica]
MDLGTKALSLSKGARRSRCNRWGTQLCNRLLLPEPTIPSPEKRRRLFFLERLSDAQRSAINTSWPRLGGSAPE